MGQSLCRNTMIEHLEKADFKILESFKYKPIPRSFKDMFDLLTPEQNRLTSYKLDIPPYLIYESTLHPKLPNITYLPNLRISPEGIMLGTTLGHQHTQKDDTRPFQELYEFHNYGAMLLRNTQGTKLHLLKPRDKITTGTEDNMTFFNLSESPLITHDMSHPRFNSANKDLEKRIGTMMLCTFSNGTFKLEVNPAYYEQGYLKRNTRVKPIVIERCELGQSLYEKLPSYKPQFANAGIELIVGGNLNKDQEGYFKKPLFDLVLDTNRLLLESLGFYDVLNYPDM